MPGAVETRYVRAGSYAPLRPGRIRASGIARVQAESRLSKTLKRWPGDAPSWDALGKILSGANSPDLALDAARKAAKLEPDSELRLAELVEALAATRKSDEALAVLQLMETQGHKNLPAGKIHHSRGNLLFWYRDYPAAIANLQRVTADAGVNTQVNSWLRLGQCYDVLGRRADALRVYRLAVDGAPDSDAAREARRYLGAPYRRN